jgi:hypothetical protein|tara:strand:+ start:108 stop:305 length:198 start_codon:yes stop_codon:yes gene_type:complete
MTFPVTGYVVFVYNDKIGSHAPQFKSMDEAESFANGVRVTTSLTVSEPIPVLLTEEIKISVKSGG